MGAPDVLARVAAAGITLTPLPDGRIWAEPSSRLTDELRALIRAHKPELLTALATSQPPPSKASQTEITRLVTAYTARLGLTEKEADEALRVALAHPDSALDYYRREMTHSRDPQVEARRQRVLAMLVAHPEARYAVLTHDPGKPRDMILTLAIRGRATCELRIPRERYDPFLLLDLIERHGATVH